MAIAFSFPTARILVAICCLVIGCASAWTSTSTATVISLRPSTTALCSASTTTPTDTDSRSSRSTSSSMPYPRAAVSVAVRCELRNKVHYLLIQRGKDPNAGRWSFPGGKLEIGETAMQGGKRELLEETNFVQQNQLQWYPETIATNDSIVYKDDGTPDFHFLIAVCFAALPSVHDSLPAVKATDDAANAQWWTSEGIVAEGIDVTPGLVERIQRTEYLYQQNVLL